MRFVEPIFPLIEAYIRGDVSINYYAAIEALTKIKDPLNWIDEPGTILEETVAEFVKVYKVWTDADFKTDFGMEDVDFYAMRNRIKRMIQDYPEVEADPLGWLDDD